MQNIWSKVQDLIGDKPIPKQLIKICYQDIFKKVIERF